MWEVPGVFFFTVFSLPVCRQPFGLEIHYARNTHLTQRGKCERRTEMAQLPHPKGNSHGSFCLKIFTRWINAYKSRVLLKYNESTWRWQLRNKSICNVWKVTGRGWKMLPRESLHSLPLGRAGSLFQPHDYVSRQTKLNGFQEPWAGLVWFLNLATEILT